MDTHSDTEIQVTGGGSSIGVQAAGEGTADIGMSSRDLKGEEKARYPDLVSTVIGNDGIAVIVHPANTVGPLTLEEIQGDLPGEIYELERARRARPGHRRGGEGQRLRHPRVLPRESDGQGRLRGGPNSKRTRTAPLSRL